MTTWETISNRFSPVKTCANRHGHRTRAGDDLHHVPQQNGTQMKTNITHFTIIIHHQWWSIPGTECHQSHKFSGFPLCHANEGWRPKDPSASSGSYSQASLLKKLKKLLGCLLGGISKNMFKKMVAFHLSLCCNPRFRNYFFRAKNMSDTNWWPDPNSQISQARRLPASIKLEMFSPTEIWKILQ